MGAGRKRAQGGGGMAGERADDTVARLKIRGNVVWNQRMDWYDGRVRTSHGHGAPWGLGPLDNGHRVVRPVVRLRVAPGRADGRARAEGIAQRLAPRLARARFQDARPRGLEILLARVARTARGGGVVSDGLVERVVVVGRLEAHKRPDGRGGRDDAVDRVRVVHAEPRRQHAAVGAAEADEGGVRGAPLHAEVVDEVRKVGHRLLRRQVVHAAGDARRVRQARAVEPVLAEDQERTEAGGRFPHEAGVVHVQLDIVLVPKVEEHRPVVGLVPPLVVDKVALPEGRVRHIAEWRRPVEVVNVLLKVVSTAVLRAWAALEGATFATGKRRCRGAGGEYGEAEPHGMGAHECYGWMRRGRRKKKIVHKPGSAVVPAAAPTTPTRRGVNSSVKMYQDFENVVLV